jgi:ABC-type transport system involved in multi-copper enzyme maturation permease subunit
VRLVVLVAINFVREQRWPILVLMLWVVVLSGVGLAVDLVRSRGLVLSLFKQSAVYGIAFAVFFGASAIHNECKSRRILAVLSKGVSRARYVSGLLSGIILATGIYSLSMGVTGTWVLGAGGFDLVHLWFLMLCQMLACLLAATVAVFFATFLSPLFAALATFIVLGLPAVTALEFGTQSPVVVPVYLLLQQVTTASFHGQGPVPGTLLLWAVAEAVAFWVVAEWTFSRRDIAVAVD